jgi:predicted naringenin-chalcone synthase
MLQIVGWGGKGRVKLSFQCLRSFALRAEDKNVIVVVGCSATILPSENPRIVKYLTREKSITHE